MRPILADKCFRCHGPDAAHRKADLRLDVAPAKDDARALAPGKPDASELVRRIQTADPDEAMPPPDSGKTLSRDEIATLRRWIEQGAKWSQHWAFVPPERIHLNPDCGFGTFAERPMATAEVAYRKLCALAQAARTLRS